MASIFDFVDMGLLVNREEFFYLDTQKRQDIKVGLRLQLHGLDSRSTPNNII